MAMIELKELVKYLDEELEINSIQDKCCNGLQIEGKPNIENVGIACDVTLQSITKAIEQKCDLIIVHHALIWEPVSKMTGLMAKRAELLFKNGISLYVAHLPLDIHRRYSHGMLLAEELGLYGISKFGKADGHYFGFWGYIRNKMTIEQLKEHIDKKIKTNCRMFPFGKKEITNISIISGGGGFSIEEAAAIGIDCYITGEMRHSDLLKAKDLKVNVILAGHYETEQLGLIRLGQRITKKFKTQYFFLES
jgi:dinuclear metal center YbgI/SA1388 family protein